MDIDEFAAMKFKRSQGVTLLELVIVITIILLLMGAAVPVAKLSVKRQKETDLRRDLYEMRSAIDRYKDAADKNAFQVKLGTEGYPPDLDTLVNGVEAQGGKKIRFLRRIPIDPMTGNKDWACARCRTIQPPIPGAGRTCLMCIARQAARP